MKTINLVCGNCNDEFIRPLKEYSRQMKKGKSEFYCCQSCATFATRTKAKNIQRECAWCKTTFISTTHKKYRKCCSVKCSKQLSQSHVNTRNISDALRKISSIEEISCKLCNKTFRPRCKTRKFCSVSCNSKFKWKYHRDDMTNKLKRGIRKSVTNGTWNVWRKNNEPSYPEKYFMRILDENNVPYEYEKPMGIYSIDFAFSDKKLALEIDGQQHLKPDRIVSDARKDKFLSDNGWRVFRIPWVGVANKKFQNITEEYTRKFFDLYKSMGS